MTVEPGDIFGWSALINPYKATSTVVSLEPVKVIAFDADGMEEWRSEVALCNDGDAPGIADLDADGVPEVFVGLHVLSGDTGRTVWSAT